MRFILDTKFIGASRPTVFVPGPAGPTARCRQMRETGGNKSAANSMAPPDRRCTGRCSPSSKPFPARFLMAIRMKCRSTSRPG